MNMSGEMAARALQHRFESIRRSEFARLNKKVASLSAEDRAKVEAITAQVVSAIAQQPARALTHDRSPVLVRALVELFNVRS
jgi:Glutamyl-tRNAGlu reductase, dimerisation domain